MNKNSVIGYLLIFLIFAGYLVYTSKQSAELQKQQQVQDSIQRANQPLDTLEQEALVEKSQDSLTIAAADSNQMAKPDTLLPEQIIPFENEFVKLFVSSKGGRIASVELKDYKRSDSTKLILFDADKTTFDYTIPLLTGVVQTGELDFKPVKQDGKTLVMEHQFAGGGSITQTYTFDDKHFVNYQVGFVGLQDKIAKKHNTFDLKWRITAPLQERTAEDERTVSTIYFKYFNDDEVDYLSETGYEEQTLQTNVHWISYKQKFFMSTLIFPKGLQESGTTILTEEPKSEKEVKHMTSTFSVPYDFKANSTQDFKFYFGPNHYKTLKSFDVELEKTISLGWGIIGWVNKLVVIPIFNWLSKFFTNYGLIILLLTLIIKMVLIAPMYKIYISSAKMKLLKPELDELKEKTGGDMQKMQQEQMKLYKKAGVSPFGGCLPQLIQFPILIAMFRFFPASIELRQKPFLWANDLSTFDSIYNFPGDFEIPFYGSHISLFTILMALSSMLYTIYNAQSTGLTGQMKYIMYLMPIMLLVWFNSYSSGLSYYYFLANVITFGQNYVFKTWIVDEDKLHKQIEANKKKKGAGQKSNFQRKLEEMAKKRGVDPNAVMNQKNKKK